MKAVFLDRDGVLNEMILNPSTGEHESPHEAKDLKIAEGAFTALQKLRARRFELFIVSNQPSYAKGKAPLEKINQVARQFEKVMAAHSIEFKKVYYCFHHPESIVPELKQKCLCRKPGNLFLQTAAAEFKVNLKESWMVGDRDIDIECGQSAGCRTALIEYSPSQKSRGRSKPTFTVDNIDQAAEKILSSSDDQKINQRGEKKGEYK